MPPYHTELKHYTDWLSRRGIEYKILTPESNICEVDLIMFCGGGDIGKRPLRDEFEKKVFLEAYGKIPIFGICRGMQLANVVLGGSLIEDIKSFVKHTPIKMKDDRKISSFHKVVTEHGNSFLINSRHHQGLNVLAEGIRPTMWSDGDRIVESVEGKKSFFVQWHPELNEVYDTEAERICSTWIKNNVVK